MTNKPCLLVVFLFSTISVCAQEKTVFGNMTLVAGYNGPDQVPFWIRSNQFGSVPPAGASAGLIGSIYKNYSATPKKIDWGFGSEVRLNVGGTSSSSATDYEPSWFSLIEGYGKIKYGIFELEAGRTKDITGLCDTILSSGSWAVSGNSLGIPKIEFSIPEFVSLPFFDRIFAIKLSYANGFMGNWYLDGEKVPNTPTYLLQHTLYGRLGRPEWKLKLYGGFNHQVVWGNENNILGTDYKLNGFQTFIYANIAKAYSNGEIQNMRVGNHLGSIDVGATYDFGKTELFVYRQFLYDAGALYYLANLRDGLNGISITNRNITTKPIKWQKVVFEFLYTKNQAGEIWSPYTTSLYENYYNNSYYNTGWSYKGNVTGNPFISSPGTLKEGLPLTPETFDNNRVIAYYCGLQFSIYDWLVFTRLSYSNNYGNYRTSDEGKIWDGENTETPFGIFPKTNEFSGYLSTSKELKNNITIGFTCALDRGGLFENGFGVVGRIDYRL